MATARVVQWTTGLVGRQAVRAIAERSDLELVGAYAFSPEKVGVDVGELAGLGRELGVRATDDIDALIALDPDCVVYMPLHPDLGHMTRLLRSGINIVTTAGFVTGRAMGASDLATLEAACQEGQATLFGSGIHPGHTDYLAAIAAGICREVHYVKVIESADLSLWAADANQDEFGWGRPARDPGHADDIRRVTDIDADAVDLLGRLLGVQVDDIRCDVEFAHATMDLDIPGRIVRQGSVAGIDLRWIGSCDGIDVVEVNLRWTLGSALEPAWTPEFGFAFEIKGEPCVDMKLMFYPGDMTNLTIEDMAGVGHLATAMPVVNAIHTVVAAPPGAITYADIPPFTARLTPLPQN